MASIVSHKHKFIFCHIPRTAGTSFTECVRPYLGENDEIDTLEKHTPLSALLKGRFKDIFWEYTKVAILRNPEDRFASLAKDPPENSKPSDEYWWPDKKWVCDDEGHILADKLLEFEQLPNSALNFLNSIGIPCKEFPHLNKREVHG